MILLQVINLPEKTENCTRMQQLLVVCILGALDFALYFSAL